MNEAIRQIPGGMGDAELDFLYSLVKDAPPDALIVELGAWKGRSTAALYDAMHDDQTVCTVDTWLGQADIRHTDHHDVLDSDVFLEFLDNMLEYRPIWYEPGLSGATYLRMFADDAATLFADRSVYAVNVDADHNEVGHDTDTWGPKIAPGGILCGHDWHWKGVQGQLQSRVTIKEIIGDLWVADPLKQPAEVAV